MDRTEPPREATRDRVGWRTRRGEYEVKKPDTETDLHAGGGDTGLPVVRQFDNLVVDETTQQL